MVEALIKVLDRMIQLLTVRRKRRVRLFTELWQPTFEELRTVHSDYLTMFQSCSTMLKALEQESVESSRSLRLKDIAAQLRDRRIAFEPVRRQLIALIHHSQNLNLDGTSKQFLDAVLLYFPTGTNRTLSPTYASEMLVRFDALILSVEIGENQLHNESLEELQIYVHGVIASQRRAWERVCEAYAALQTQSATSDV
jgi:hypothetical protein